MDRMRSSQETDLHMKMDPKVSVIIPLFNARQYVRGAIDSVLSQTYRNIEIIVVDDGSTDNPEIVLEKYSDRIKFIRLEENKGPSIARNIGIRTSTGEYLVFLDADDYVSTEKIEMEIEVLEKHPETGWVYESSLTFDEDGRVFRELPQKFLQPNEDPPQGKIFHRLILRNLMVVNAVMIKRGVLDVGTFDESLRGFEDWDLWLRVSAKYEVKYIDKALAFVRFHPDSSQRNVIRFWSDKLRVIDKISRLYPSLTDPYRNEIIKVLAEAYYYVGLGYYHKDEFRESASQFLKAIWAYPFQRRVYFDLTLAILKFLRIPVQ